MSPGWPTGHPPERPPATTARALADLARAGFEVLDRPSTQVEYQIHHAADRPGGLAAVVAALPDDTVFAEVLSSAANGAGLVVGTRIGDSGPAARGRHSWLDVVEATDFRATFRGSERPNLTFRHETTERFEGIICIENEPRKMLLRHGLAVTDTLRHITDTGLQADAPLLSLQCPAQLPTQTFQDAGSTGRRTVEPVRSSTIAIRFAMALERPNADVRLQIADRLARHCLDRGLGLWLRDTRSGYRAGNWFLVLAHDTPQARQSYRRTADVSGPRGSSNAAQACLPVTLVGPARPGSTHAILTFLSQYPQVGILGCSMRTLDELAFLHLQLAVNGATRPRVAAVNAALGEIRAAEGRPDDVLRAIVPQLLREGEPVGDGREHAETLLGRAGDYHTAIGPALTIVADHVTRRIPIWLSWQLPPLPGGMRVPVTALQRALDRLDLTDADVQQRSAGAPSIEYLACGRHRGSLIHGTGKLAVSKNLVDRRFAGHRSPTARLCTDLQAAWAVELAAAGHTGRPGELSVSPHESWLGTTRQV